MAGLAGVPALLGSVPALFGSLIASTPASVHLAHASAWAVFATGAVLILSGAVGVILLRNPVHCALMLVVTLFGVAVEFIDESADFLAAVQIIVYAGAVVILFLFVIMFLGVDRREVTRREPFIGQKPLAIIMGLVTFAELLILSRVGDWTSGAHSLAGTVDGPGENIQKLGQSIYTRYLLPFEMTSALLVIAVVATVVLARQQLRTASELTADEQDAVASSVAAASSSPSSSSGAGR
jgi:NADH-quinone oxidoreductase subunit J